VRAASLLWQTRLHPIERRKLGLLLAEPAGVIVVQS